MEYGKFNILLIEREHRRILRSISHNKVICTIATYVAAAGVGHDRLIAHEISRRLIRALPLFTLCPSYDLLSLSVDQPVSLSVGLSFARISGSIRMAVTHNRMTEVIMINDSSQHLELVTSKEWNYFFIYYSLLEQIASFLVIIIVERKGIGHGGVQEIVKCNDRLGDTVSIILFETTAGVV